MPRAGRYIVAGRTYRITHRCHNRTFLFRFGVDHDAYRAMLRERARRYGIVILNYCVTCNHTHLLLTTREPEETLSRFMQSLEGDFAQYFNLRKARSGAFWGDRYHATMIDGGDYLWRCMMYIDLNMVRAGVVEHPREWAWTGYAELMGLRQRYRAIDQARLYELVGGRHECEFRQNYDHAIREAVAKRDMMRDARWTECLAVGSEAFAREVGERIRNRMEVEVVQDRSKDGAWLVRETSAAYS